MGGGQREGGGDDAALGPGAHQAGVTPGTQRQAQHVQQDGLAGTGFASEDGEAALQGEIELLDQDNVTDGQGSEHESLIAEPKGNMRGVRWAGNYDRE